MGKTLLRTGGKDAKLLGNNVMISKIEKESTEGEEESLPSVIKIKTPEKR